MKKFIFITSEGFTYQPDSLSSEPDIENLQVLGFGEGKTAYDAATNMMSEYPYLIETNFDDVIAIEIKDEEETALSLKELILSTNVSAP